MFDPMRCKEAGFAVGAVADHMHMRVVRLVMERGIPPKLLQRDLHCLRHLHRVRGEKAFPALRVIESQPRGIFPTKGDHWQPDCAGMVCNFVLYFG